jgi:tetratricopeptide (TPR) repeat protein
MGDEVPRHATGKTIGFVAVGVVVLAGVALGVVYRDRLKSLFSGNQVDSTYQAARKLFLLDDEESLRLADQQLAKGSQNNALVQAARAEIYSTWVQHLRDHAEILERRARILETGSPSPAQADEPKRLRLQATGLKNEAERRLGEAESHAKKAVDLGPERGEVKRAMADYLRVQGRNTREVLPFLAAARKTLPEDPEALYVEGAFWGSQGNVSRAEDLLKEALTKTRAQYGQSLIRAAFQLAMIHLHAGRRPDARAQAESILAANDKHRWARELLDLTTLEDRQPPPVATRPDSGAAPAPDGTPKPPTPGGAPKPPAPGGTPKPPTPGGAPPAVVAGGGSYEQLVKEGNALSEKGRTMQAFKLFDRALKLKPAGLEAHTGIGYCHLDQERFAAAIGSFKKALAIAPTFGEALIGMAEAYKVQGNNAKALDYYRAYLQANPSGSKATLAKRNVADLERKVGTPAPGPAPTPGGDTPVPTPAPAPAPEPKAAPAPSSALPDKTGS